MKGSTLYITGLWMMFSHYIIVQDLHGIRMHSSSMHTICCSGCLSCHACPLPHMPPSTHVPLPHMPPFHTCLPSPHMPLFHTFIHATFTTDAQLCHSCIPPTMHGPFTTHSPLYHECHLQPLHPPCVQTDTFENVTYAVRRYTTTVGSSGFGVSFTKDVPQFSPTMAHSSNVSGSVQPQMSFVKLLQNNVGVRRSFNTGICRVVPMYFL